MPEKPQLLDLLTPGVLAGLQGVAIKQHAASAAPSSIVPLAANPQAVHLPLLAPNPEKQIKDENTWGDTESESDSLLDDLGYLLDTDDERDIEMLAAQEDIDLPSDNTDSDSDFDDVLPIEYDLMSYHPDCMKFGGEVSLLCLHFLHGMSLFP